MLFWQIVLVLVLVMVMVIDMDMDMDIAIAIAKKGSNEAIKIVIAFGRPLEDEKML